MISQNLLSDKDFSWFDVEEPGVEDFDTLYEKFDLPFLLVQDTLRPEHLPKYELSDEEHFLMLRSYDQESTSEATTVQELTRKIALFIKPGRLLSVHRVSLPFLVKIIERAGKSNKINSIEELVHLIVIGVIRSYEEPISHLQDIYDEFETDVISKQCNQLNTTRIYHFRRKLFVLKRILKQTNDALYRSKDFWQEQPSMLQDLKENIDQIYFELDEISDNFEHLFQLHISLNDQRANDVMKVLTVFSTIILPINFIASFFGMNFDNLPWIHSPHAVSVVVLLMVIVSLCGVWLFKRKGWFERLK